MDRFKSDSKSEDFSYKLQDLNFELKQKFGIEFSNFDDLKTINKGDFSKIFNKQKFIKILIILKKNFRSICKLFQNQFSSSLHCNFHVQG